ncbi:hypothetical protein [Streptomyces peucetius]|uniref:hypothetical protein n=1 Tax=Streptomyces peucetius TaxID=1950 RepID=UPI00299F56CD|nr:hypothetical protein [Streptomyces peucetius]
MRAAAVGGAAVLVGAAVPAAVWLRRRGARCDSGAEPVRAEAAALGNQRQTL